MGPIMPTRLPHALAALALLTSLAALVTMAILPKPVAAQESSGGYIEVHNRICPGEKDFGGDHFAECHETVPDPGLPFTITTVGGSVLDEDVTDGNGNVYFTGLAAGTYTISGGVPGEFADAVIYCSVAADGGTPFPFTPVTVGIQLTIDADDRIVCDWYNVPYDQRGELTGTLEFIKIRCEGEPETRMVVFTPLEVAGGLAEAGDDSCRGGRASFHIIPFGDETQEPISVDAQVGVNTIELPVGDHVLVELGSGASAEFPIEELATTRVYVINPRTPDGGGVDETVPLPITKFDCTANPGDAAINAVLEGGTPAGCTRAADVRFSVAADDGTPVGVCRTDASGICAVEVLIGATVVITEDVATGTPGFVPVYNPIEVVVNPQSEAFAVFVNLPAGGTDDDDDQGSGPTPRPGQAGGVTRLPSTGAGAEQSNDAAWLWLLLGAASAAGFVAAAGRCSGRLVTGGKVLEPVMDFRR